MITQEQTAHGTATTLSFTPMAVGNLIVVCVSLVSSTATVSLSGLGVTWTRAVRSNPSSAAGVSEIWYGAAVNTTAGTITATITGTYSQIRLAAGEFEGASSATTWAVDVTGASTSTAAMSRNKSAQFFAARPFDQELYVWNMTFDHDELIYAGQPIPPLSDWFGFGAGDHYQKAFATIIASQGYPIYFDWYIPSGTIHVAQAAVMFLSNGVPLAPDLLAPGPSNYVDVSSGYTFDWDYNTGGSDNQQEGYQLRLKPSGGSYKYWNAGTNSWQGTPITNMTVNTNATVPTSADLANGNVYNWSVATYDNGGLGPFQSDGVFTTQDAPTVTPTAPSGTIANATPTVTWSNTVAAGAAQDTYRVVTYNAAQYGAGGFTPGSGPSADDSGVVSSAATTYTIATPLVPGTTYRSYIFITESPGEQGNATAFASFDFEVEGPAKPIITAVAVDTPLTGMPRVDLTIDCRDNWLLYTESQAGGLATTGWVPGANTTVTATSSGAEDAQDAILMHATAGGNVSMATLTGLSAFPVTPGALVRALASFHATSIVRSCTVKIFWWQASGAASILRPSDTSAAVNSTLSGYAQANIQTTAPNDAAFASIEIDAASLGAGETLEVDEVLLGPGAGLDWYRGGLNGLTYLTVQRSDGTYVKGVGPDDNFLVAWPGQIMIVHDYGAVNYQEYTYNAQVLAPISGNIVSSPISDDSNAVTVVPTQWWIWPINNPNMAMGLHRASHVSAIVTTGGEASMQFDRTELQASFLPMGRTDYVVVHGDMKDESFMLSLVFFGDAEWYQFDALRNLQTDMAIRSDLNGEIFFVAFGPDRPAVLLRGDLYTGEPVRQCDIKFLPIAKPTI